MFDEEQGSEYAPTDKAQEGLRRLRATLPVSAYSQISEISLYFERVWEKERCLSIEDCLELVDEEIRVELFERLLEVDVSLGIEQDGAISPEEYKKRFPQWSDTIDSVYERLACQSGLFNKTRIGRNIGNYQIEQVLGKGGMGVVYKALDIPFNRTVAIKYLLPSQRNREECVKLFRQEMELMGKLPSDAPIARPFHYDRDGSFDYFVMDYVEGVNLAQSFKNSVEKRLKSDEIEWREAATYVLKIAEGLELIHQYGIVHRDIKPENVMVAQNGRVLILDLGLGAFRNRSFMNARSETDEQLRSSVVGTLAYMSPEGYQTPGAVDGRSDLYSLGGTFFYMLTGRPPIVWHSPTSSKTPISLEEYFRREKIVVCSDVLAILTRLLEPDVDRRYQHASDVVRDLNKLLLKYSPKQTKRRAWLAVFFIALSVSMIAAVGWNLYEREVAVKRLGVAESYCQSGCYDKALDVLKLTKVENLSDANKYAFFVCRGDASLKQALATDNKDKETYRVALKDFEQALTFPNDAAVALTGAARCAVRCATSTEEFSAAKDFAVRAVKAEPENDATRLVDAEVSVLSLEFGSWDTNEEFMLYNQILGLLDAVKNDPKTCYWRAKAHHCRMLDDLALEYLDRAIEQNVEYEDARRLRAEILFIRANRSTSIESTQSVALEAAEDLKFVASYEKDPQRRILAVYRLALCYFLAGEREAFEDVCNELNALKNEFSNDSYLTAIYAKIKIPFLTGLKDGYCETDRKSWKAIGQKAKTEMSKAVKLQMEQADYYDLEDVCNFIERASRRFNDRDMQDWDELAKVWLDDSLNDEELKTNFDVDTTTFDATKPNEETKNEENEASSNRERDEAERLFQQLLRNEAPVESDASQEE